MTVVIVAGLPASGKSTWIREHYPDAPVLDMEALRLELLDEFPESYSNWKARMHLAQDRILEYAAQPEPPAVVVVEGIFWPNTTSLDLLQSFLRGLCHDFPVEQDYHLMDTPAAICRQRVVHDYLDDGNQERRDGRLYLIDIYEVRR